MVPFTDNPFHLSPRSRPALAIDGFAASAAPAVTASRIWRCLPKHQIGVDERAALADLLATARPAGVAHWDEARVGDAAAAVAAALMLAGVDVLDTARHDLVMSMVLMHALAGSMAARTVLAGTLERRAYLGEDVDALVASWASPSRAQIRRASIEALVEALS